MSNFNLSTRGQPSQLDRGHVDKLVSSGLSLEMISSAFELNLETLQHYIGQQDLELFKKVVDSIKAKFKEYRSTQSNRLVVSPVMTSEGSLHEQRFIETLSQDSTPPLLSLKTELSQFSKESLSQLEIYLKQRHPPEECLELTAECLSVLSPDTDMDTIVKVFGAVDGETAQQLTGHLRKLVPAEFLGSLLSCMVKDLPSQAPYLVRLLLSEPTNKRVYEQAFSSLTEMLRTDSDRTAVIQLAKDFAERLSSSQLSQLNAVVMAGATKGRENRLEELRLAEANVRLREGDYETARALVKTLHGCLRLKEEVLEFYDRAGWSREKQAFLAEVLQASLEKLRQESPSLADTLKTLQQFTQAELQSLKTEVQQSQRPSRKVESLSRDLAESLSLLRSTQKEVDQHTKLLHSQALQLNHLARLTDQFAVEPEGQLMSHEDVDIYPTFIYSYSFDTDQLYRTCLVTGEESCHSIPSYTFKMFSSWSDLPGERIMFTGGYCSQEAVTIDTLRSFAVAHLPPMQTPRCLHSSLYHDYQVYVLGGMLESEQPISQCELYCIPQRQWQALPPLPTACYSLSSVVVKGQLYALGGRVNFVSALNLIQRLNLDRLTWEVMQLKLPAAGANIPCFSASLGQVCLVIEQTLYSFNPDKQDFAVVTTLQEDALSWCGPSYYYRPTLYCSNGGGAADKVIVGA
jgi:endonuclease III